MTSEDASQQTPEPTPEPKAAEPAAPKRTLDDIYRDFPGAVQAQQQTPPVQSDIQPPPAPAPITHVPPETVPDPVTAPQDYAKWVAQQQADIKRQVTEMSARQALEREEARRTVDKADLTSAVDFISDGIQAADKDLVRGYLYSKAEDDKRLAQLFNNRRSNPSAWDAALSVLKDDVRQKFAARTDPQLVENQAALDNAMRNASTTAPAKDDVQTSLMKKSHGDFAREWERIKAGVYDNR